MKVFKRILKYSAWLISIFIILIIALIIFIQTELFNKWALSYTINSLNESESWIKKDNFISAESINGNILKGLRINKAVITVKKDTLISADFIDLKYNIWGLMNKSIYVDYAVINSPVVNLYKIAGKSDSLIWNFTGLFEPSGDTTASDFDWHVYVDSLKVENGNFRILDTIPSKPLWALEWDKQPEFNINKLNVSDFQLETKIEYSKQYSKISIRNLSFASNTDFALKRLSLDAFINDKDTLTDIADFVLITDRSDIKIGRLSVNGINPVIDGSFNNFENTKILLNLGIDKFDFADLRFFFPDLDILDSTVSLYINANGMFRDLDVNSLTLNLPGSNININGNIKNMSVPDSMYLDVYLSGKIDASDIKKVLKSTSIPEYKRFGVILADIYYKGNLYDFNSNFDIRSNSGNLKGEGHLNLNDERYSGNIVTNNLNLASVFNDKKYKSIVNLNAEFDGIGFTPQTMSTGIKYRLNNSSALGYNIKSSSGKINILRNNIGMDIKVNSRYGIAAVTGKINISNMKNPVYSLKGKVNNVDISSISGSKEDKSNLNSSFDINGSGIGLNNLTGRFNFDVGNSIYSGFQIPNTNINANLLSADSSSIQVTNKAMEMKANGTFSLYDLVDAILYNISSFSNIAEKKLFPDTSSYSADISQYNHSGNVNITYKFITKDSTELKKLTSPLGIVFNGEINGNLTNSKDEFYSTSSVFINKFVYRDTSIVLNNLKSNIVFSNDYRKLNDEAPLSSFALNMDMNADRIMIDSGKYDSLKALITLSESLANLYFKGNIKPLNYAMIKSTVDLRGDQTVFTVDSLYAKYFDYSIVNNNVWTINYIPNQEFNVKQLGLKTGNMVLNLDGYYSLYGISDININGDNINLGQIYEIIRPFDTTLTGEKNIYPVKGELKKLYVHLEGTPDDVNIGLEVKTNTLTFDSVGIGTIEGTVTYKDRILSPDINITNHGEKNNIQITGSIPFDNPFVQIDTTAARGDKPAELHLKANNFEIQYFTKLFPGIGDLRGVLDGSINADGSYFSPNLNGELTMTKGKYLLDLTGMYYDFKFKISTNNSKLLIDYISLYNPDDDTRHIDLRGTIDFRGYSLKDIDLTTSGDMVLLDKGNKENRLGLKGYILGGIGTPPVTIKGDLDKLDVKGQFVFKETTITSLPDSRKGYQKDEKNIIYLSALDSAFSSDTSRRKISINEYESINPFVRNRYILVDSVKSFSVLEMLNLDLDVKTDRNANISIDFDNLTRDRLFGEVMANLRLRTVRGRLLANGEVNVVGNSYYRFYRDFKVKESKIIFKGPIENPELDIRAVYADIKSTEQFGTISTNPIEVVLTVKGNPSNPEITLKLYENGTEMQGNDATSDALTFLLFGKYKNELSASESQSVATGIGSTVGSLYVTSFLGQILRDMLPFISDAELNYTEGGLQNTNVSVSSNMYGANITVGSRVIDNNAYLEFNVEYPLNNLLDLKLPEKVLLQFAREQLNSSVITNMDVYYSTGIKIAYKYKF
ncbi:MAG: hypothetical protein WC139_02325 [Candidatus Kapaibacterium sp.]